MTIDQLLDDIAGGMYGQTPVDGSWAWLLVVAPHSSTPFDLAQTMGSAAFVLGVCLAVAGLVGDRGRRALAVFFGAGTMTLSLYTLHVLMRTERVLAGRGAGELPLARPGADGHRRGLRRRPRRGPLEWLVARAGRAVSGAATR